MNNLPLLYKLCSPIHTSLEISPIKLNMAYAFWPRGGQTEGGSELGEDLVILYLADCNLWKLVSWSL